MGEERTSRGIVNLRSPDQPTGRANARPMTGSAKIQSPCVKRMRGRGAPVDFNGESFLRSARALLGPPDLGAQRLQLLARRAGRVPFDLAVARDQRDAKRR